MVLRLIGTFLVHGTTWDWYMVKRQLIGSWYDNVGLVHGKTWYDNDGLVRGTTSLDWNVVQRWIGTWYNNVGLVRGMTTLDGYVVQQHWIGTWYNIIFM